MARELELIRAIREEANHTLKLYTLHNSAPLYQVAIKSLLKIEAMCNQYESEEKCQSTNSTAQTASR